MGYGGSYMSGNGAMYLYCRAMLREISRVPLVLPTLVSVSDQTERGV